jgi:hypothetical protein
MKKASLIASAAAASIALAAAPVFAQGGPFADVPTDHWAYAAVDKLQKQGIVIGYPDGTYGGKRQMTRYEFAIAIARLLDKIQAPPAAATPDLSDYVKKEDLAGLAKQSDVDTLRKLVQEFQTELTTLGVDLDAVKKRLDALDARVKALEDAQKRVRISGTITAMGRANNRFKTDVVNLGNGTTAQSVVDASGFQVTRGAGSKGSLLADARVFNDLDLNVDAYLGDKVRGEATINFGNYLSFLNSIGSGSGARSDRVAVGAYPGQTVHQDQDQTIYKADITGTAGPIGFSVGRVLTQFTPYTLKLIDVDYYFTNDKTDSGNIPVDGGIATLKFGSFNLLGIAAKTDPIKYLSNINGTYFPGQSAYGIFAGAGHGAYGGPFKAQSVVSVAPNGATFLTGNRPVGSLISPGGNGAMAIEQFGGGRVTFGKKEGLYIGGTYLYFSGPSASAPVDSSLAGSDADKASFNRVAVYGGDASLMLGKALQLTGSYTKSDTGGERIEGNSINTDTKSKITSNNDAWDAAAKLIFGSFDLSGGYREIGPYFGAPGYWLRLGSFYNPVDIKGPYGRAAYNFKKGATLFVEGHGYKGTGKAVDNGGLSTDDKINNIRAGFNLGLGSASDVLLGYETTQYDVASATGGRVKPHEDLIDLGIGYKTSNNSNVRVLYQIINYDDKDSGFDPTNGKGGVLATQFQVKF